MAGRGVAAKEVRGGKVQCSRCRKWKLATTEYFQKGSTKLGLASECKVCSSTDSYKKRAADGTPIKRRFRLGTAHAQQIRADGKKRCSSCRRWKNGTPKNFFRDKNTPTGLDSECKRCMAVKNSKYRSRQGVNVWLKSKYGITIDDYDRLLEAQGGVCKICGEAAGAKRRLAVDHCHTHGHVRALLCTKCNVGLGAFRDRPDLLQQAISYLHDHAA